MKFSINDLVTFTEEIFNGKLPLLCSETSLYFSWINLYNLNTPDTSLNRVSLHVQSEYGKIRTRKNTVFGHFSLSDLFSNMMVMNNVMPPFWLDSKI